MYRLYSANLLTSTTLILPFPLLFRSHSHSLSPHHQSALAQEQLPSLHNPIAYMLGIQPLMRSLGICRDSPEP
ncbi:hypothetical protein P167DRAFT_539683 [Morchella conica CCBAS932]|uniref:Uncharacterized protein n=1 Tax=Morchella conica CCBAS932 TaxID=1392247 RepID=A0A3N4KF61_9PEZI|nr:hypothetical protein P167DRAFT_539683 [Morchella conica CCBAS932]